MFLWNPSTSRSDINNNNNNNSVFIRRRRRYFTAAVACNTRWRLFSGLRFRNARVPHLSNAALVRVHNTLSTLCPEFRSAVVLHTRCVRISYCYVCIHAHAHRSFVSENRFPSAPTTIIIIMRSRGGGGGRRRRIIFPISRVVQGVGIVVVSAYLSISFQNPSELLVNNSHGFVGKKWLHNNNNNKGISR